MRTSFWFLSRHSPNQIQLPQNALRWIQDLLFERDNDDYGIDWSGSTAPPVDVGRAIVTSSSLVCVIAAVASPSFPPLSLLCVLFCQDKCNLGSLVENKDENRSVPGGILGCVRMHGYFGCIFRMFSHGLTLPRYRPAHLPPRLPGYV